MRIKLLCVSVAVTLANFAFALNPKCPKPIRVGWDTYPPYQIEDPYNQSNVTGIDAEFAKAVIENSGCQVSFVHDSWKRQLYNLEQGEIDIVSPLFRKAK